MLIAMTVADLIAYLSNLPSDMPVLRGNERTPLYAHHLIMCRFSDVGDAYSSERKPADAVWVESC
jgi:hypothetical protein